MMDDLLASLMVATSSLFLHASFPSSSAFWDDNDAKDAEIGEGTT